MSRAVLDHPLLSETETRELIVAYRKGDQNAAARLIEHNEKAIWRMARRYQSTGVCGDLEIDDLMQYGRIGLLRAMKDFDVEGTTKFITYAWNWIRLEVSRNGKHDGQQVHLSYRASEHRGRVGKARNEFIQKNHREPTPRELSAITNLKEEYIASLKPSVASLDMPIGANSMYGGARKSYADIIPAPNANPEAESEERLVVESALEKIKKMPKRWQYVVIRLYGLDGKAPATFRDIARKLGISHQRVNQIKDSVLAELKNSMY